MVIAIMDRLIKQAMRCNTDNALEIDHPNKVRSPNDTRSVLKSLIRELQRKAKSASPTSFSL
jgi:hypothetical protein